MQNKQEQPEALLRGEKEYVDDRSQETGKEERACTCILKRAALMGRDSVLGGLGGRSFALRGSGSR